MPVAQRIVSLLPSATETVCAVGLEDRLVGVSHSCDYPPAIRSKPRLTRPRLPLDGLSSGEIDAAPRSSIPTSSRAQRSRGERLHGPSGTGEPLRRPVGASKLAARQCP